MKQLSLSPKIWQVLICILILATISACGESSDESDNDNQEVTADRVTEVSIEVSDTPTETLTPTITDTPGGPTITPSNTFPPTVTREPTATDIPDSTAIPPTDVPPPFTHRVAEGETCGGIANQYGLEFAGGAAAIEAANGISCGSLQIGQELTIPRPTGTPTPQGFEQTETAVFTSLPPALRGFSPQLYEYCPEPEDTLTSIALKNGTTQQRICELNPLPDGLNCRGCDFSDSSVGYCPTPPIISEFNCLMVPGPTFTPTATPTFTGSETATATPTYAAPFAVQPQNNSTIQGPVLLIWVSVGQLQENQFYQVAIIDEATDESYFDVVKTTNLSVPMSWQPSAGQSRQILWTVDVVEISESGQYIPISGLSQQYRFTWQG